MNEDRMDSEVSWRCPEHGERARVAVCFDAKAWFRRFPDQRYLCFCDRECVPYQYGEPARGRPSDTVPAPPARQPDRALRGYIEQANAACEER